METIGEFLKQKREEKKLTIESVAEATKVSLGMLIALEKNDLKKIPSLIFVRGFVFSYAKHLGLDPEQVYEDFKAPLAAYYDELMQAENAQGASSRDGGVKVLLGALVLLAVAAGSFYAYDLSQPQDNSSSPNGSMVQTTVISLEEDEALPMDELMDEAALEDLDPESLSLTVNIPKVDGLVSEEESVLDGAPGVSDGLPPSFGPEASLGAGEPSSVAKVPENLKELTLSIEALEESWVVAKIDDSGLKEILLHPGEKVYWTAQKKFVLTLGNAGGVKLIYNGKPLKPPGEPGAVLRNFVLSR